MNKIITALSTLIIIAVGLIGYTAVTGNSLFTSSLSSQTGERLVTDSIDTMSKNILLTDDEKQNFSAVQLDSSHEALKNNNAFYENAKPGDLVYIFQNRVIIFRPSNKQIINTAPYLGGADFDPSTITGLDESKIIDPQ